MAISGNASVWILPSLGPGPVEERPRTRQQQPAWAGQSHHTGWRRSGTPNVNTCKDEKPSYYKGFLILVRSQTVIIFLSKNTSSCDFLCLTEASRYGPLDKLYLNFFLCEHSCFIYISSCLSADGAAKTMKLV